MTLGDSARNAMAGRVVERGALKSVAADESAVGVVVKLQAR